MSSDDFYGGFLLKLDMVGRSRSGRVYLLGPFSYDGGLSQGDCPERGW